MAQILIVTESPEETPRTVVYRERIAPSDFDSAHFTGQLAERVGWAVSDADRLEHSGDDAEPAPVAGAADPVMTPGLSREAVAG
jgi:hypothetical protein